MTAQASAAPVQRNEKHDPELLGEKGRRSDPAARSREEQVARHHRRQDQRQVDEGVQERLAPEAAPREQIGDGSATGKLAATATVATIRLSRTAIHSSGETSPRAWR